MYIALPSDKEERDAIWQALDKQCAKIDSILSIKRQQVDILKRRRKSLIYEYVTGKRRVEEGV